MKRRKATRPSEPQRKGRKDMECADCGKLVEAVDVNAKAVHCSVCVAKRCAPPEQPKAPMTEEQKMARAERKRQRVLAEARGEAVPAQRGRISRFAGKYLYHARKTNPRARGKAALDWDKWEDGMTYEQVLAAGCLKINLLHEINHGWIKVSDTKHPKGKFIRGKK
jgi:hypothetical protein